MVVGADVAAALVRQTAVNATRCVLLCCCAVMLLCCCAVVLLCAVYVVHSVYAVYAVYYALCCILIQV